MIAKSDYFVAVGLTTPPVTPGLTPPVVPGLTVVTGLTFAVGALVTDGFAENDGNRLIVGTGLFGWLFRVHPANTATNITINTIAMISFFIQFASFNYYFLQSTNELFHQVYPSREKENALYIQSTFQSFAIDYVPDTVVLTEGDTEGDTGDTVGLNGSVVGLTVAVGFTLVVGFLVAVIVVVG